MSKLIGVRYIGLNDIKEDTVNNTATTWVKDQVNNFSESLANNLLVHTDSFELADVNAAAPVWFAKNNNEKDLPPVQYGDINSMTLSELAFLSKHEFNRIVATDGRDVADVRTEVLQNLKIAHLTMIEEPKTETGLYVIKKEVTAAEFDAYKSGLVTLCLVPNVTTEKVADKIPANTLIKTAPTVLTHVFETVIDAEKSTKEADLPTLTELLASLSTKKELQAFAKENNVSYANSMNESQLRAKLLRELNK